MEKSSGIKIISTNKKAHFNYFLSDFLECGIELKGTEIKSLRMNNANLNDAYVIIKNNEAYILNMFIAQYDKGNIFNHEETRSRKLLLHRNEIKKIEKAIEVKGYTLIPIKLYFKDNILKVSLGVCHGKKNYDKRDSIKERDIKREVAKKLKNY